MRNHYLLYIALPRGEQGEYELIGESNSVFPSLWAVLFADSAGAEFASLSAFGSDAHYLVSTDSNSAAARLEAVSEFLCSALESGSESLADVRRYLCGAVKHVRELMTAWTFTESPTPLFAISFDEAIPPAGMSKEAFVAAALQNFSSKWRDLQRAIAECNVVEVCAHLGVKDVDMRKWRSWAGKVGLALFRHEYFHGSFRAPRAMDYEDFDYDPLGSDCELGDAKIRFKRQGRWGVAVRRDDEWLELLAPEWDRVLRAEAGTCRLVWLERNGRFGLATIAERARNLCELWFDEVWPFHDGVALVRIGGKTGYVKADGGWFLEPQWDDAWEFANGVAVVAQGDKLTYIDTAGRMLASPIFDQADAFTEFGVGRVRIGERYGLLRSDGTYALPLEYSSLEWLADLHAWNAIDDHRCLLVRADSSVWISGSFERFFCCVNERFIAACGSGRVALFDWQGEPQFECAGESIAALTSESAWFLVFDRGSAKLLDAKGEAALPSYIDVAPFDVGACDCVRVTRKHLGRPKHGVWSLVAQKEIVSCAYDLVWTVPLAAEEFAFLVATKTHVSADVHGLRYKVGMLRSDGSTLIPERFAWIGDPVSLGKRGARERVRSAIEFAVWTARPLEAERWEDGVLEKIALTVEG